MHIGEPLWDDRALALEQKIYEMNKEDEALFLDMCIKDIKRGKSLQYLCRKYHYKVGREKVRQLIEQYKNQANEIQEQQPEPTKKETTKEKNMYTETAVEQLLNDPILGKQKEFRTQKDFIKHILSDDRYSAISATRLSKITNISIPTCSQAKKDVLEAQENKTPMLTAQSRYNERQAMIEKLTNDQRFAQNKFPTAAARIRAILLSDDYCNMKSRDISIVCGCSDGRIASERTALQKKQLYSNSTKEAHNVDTEPEERVNDLDQNENDLDQNENDLDQNENDLDQNDALVFWGIVPPQETNSKQSVAMQETNAKQDVAPAPKTKEAKQIVNVPITNKTAKLFKKTLLKQIDKLKAKIEKLEKVYNAL